jgi:hypothetical protein
LRVRVPYRPTKIVFQEPSTQKSMQQKLVYAPLTPPKKTEEQSPAPTKAP